MISTRGEREEAKERQEKKKERKKNERRSERSQLSVQNAALCCALLARIFAILQGKV